MTKDVDKIIQQKENLMQVISKIAQHNSDLHLKDKRQRGSYGYIPHGIKSFIYSLERVSDLIYDASKKQYFIDVGSGYPIMPIIAQEYGYIAKGFEINEKITKLFTNYYTTKNIIEKRDILSANYHSFDIIYYYCPFECKLKQLELEKKIEFEAKVGAVIMASQKFDYSFIESDKFKVITKSDQIKIFQKVKQ